MMNENYNHRGETEQALQAHFASYTMQAEEHVWNNIQDALKEEKKRVIAWWKWASAACVAGLVLSYSIYQLKDNTAAQYSGKEPVKTERILPITDKQADETDMVTVDEAVQQGEKADVKHSGQPKTEVNYYLTSKGESASSKHLETQSNYTSQQGNAVLTEQARPELLQAMACLPGEVLIASTEDTVATRDIDEILIPLYASLHYEEMDDTQNEWSLAANLLSSNGKTGSSNGNKAEVASYDLFNEQSIDMALAGRGVTNVKYSPPLVTSATVNLGISRRWSLETGISYTLLGSTGESTETGGEQATYKTQLHYLGIPLLANFRFVSKKKFSMYCSQGLLLDKGIAFRQTETVTQNGSTVSDTKQSSGLPGFQGALSAGLGADYKVGKVISLYLQPGVSMWLLNINHANNVRNTQLLWPNLQLGARVSL